MADKPRILAFLVGTSVFSSASWRLDEGDEKQHRLFDPKKQQHLINRYPRQHG